MVSKRTSRAYLAQADHRAWLLDDRHSMADVGDRSSDGRRDVPARPDLSSGIGSDPAQPSAGRGAVRRQRQGDPQRRGRESVAQGGSLVTVPRHTEHSFVVDEDAVLINFYFPGGFDLWLMGSASPALGNHLPPPDMPLPPYELMKRLSDDYDGLPLTQERSTSANSLAIAQPSVVSRQTVEYFWFGDGCWSILADAASTGGSYSVFEVEVRRASARNPQIHDDTDVAFYLFAGEMEIFVDDEIMKLIAGSFVFVPRGFVYAFRTISETARFLHIHTSSGYERLVRAIGTPAEGPVRRELVQRLKHSISPSLPGFTLLRYASAPQFQADSSQLRTPSNLLRTDLAECHMNRTI